MGQPDGGWYDEDPPRVIGATPEEGAVNVNRRNIVIRFNEYIQLDNPTENVVVSPPQIEPAEIKGQGKSISVKLLDSLKANTTYTIDFSNAISDNNEGNPLGNYAFTFSTGDHIDTLQVSGYVLNAEDLEPIKGMLVGLYDNLSDTAFKTQPMMRVSRTDSRGQFTIKGVAPGIYRVYALQDADGNYIYNQKSEKLAFSTDYVEPTCKPDVRQDTTWLDSLHIASIGLVHYTHFLPDDICLRAFTATLTDRYLVKSDRQESERFRFIFSYGDSLLPVVRGLNFDADGAFIIEESPKRDTLTYWLRDTALVDNDSLEISITYRATDSTGVLQEQTDTLMLMPRVMKAKRMNDLEKRMKTWKKQQDKKKRRGEPYDSVMPPEKLRLKFRGTGTVNPDQNVTIQADAPLNPIDTTQIKLYSQPAGDTLWHVEPYKIDSLSPRYYRLRAAWKPGWQYSLEADSLAFSTIYGMAAGAVKEGIKVNTQDKFASLIVTLAGRQGKPTIVKLLDSSGKETQQVSTTTGQAEFYYIKEGTYYLSAIADDNGNGIWDTGDYDRNVQPEDVWFDPRPVECREKWDVTITWDPTSTPLYQQKPAQITKQRADREKTIRRRNMERARKLGIEYMPK